MQDSIGISFPDRRSRGSDAAVVRMQRGRDLWDRFNGQALRWWHALGARGPELCRW